MKQAAGKHTEALTYLQQCEKVAPGDHHTLVAQGKSLIELGRLDEAERVLRRAVLPRSGASRRAPQPRRNSRNPGSLAR